MFIKMTKVNSQGQRITKEVNDEIGKRYIAKGKAVALEGIDEKFAKEDAKEAKEDLAEKLKNLKASK